MSDTTRPTTRGAARRLVRYIHEFMPITAEHGTRVAPATIPASRFNRLPRHEIEEVLA